MAQLILDYEPANGVRLIAALEAWGFEREDGEGDQAYAKRWIRLEATRKVHRHERETASVAAGAAVLEDEDILT